MMARTNIIQDVSFTAQMGQVTAIVGPSGRSKTILLKLISRLYDYDSGKILIDGYDIKDISTDSLFAKISMVFQDVSLFNNSVLENICIGRPDATDEEVREAARMAGCEEFVLELDQGYDPFIGEEGVELSGGERQWISIARAFLKDAPILLLDELSSNLDVINETKIQNSLNQLGANKTVIIISHRLKSIENVNKIVVMNEGRIDQMGSHAYLLEESELYKDLLEKSRLAEEFLY